MKTVKNEYRVEWIPCQNSFPWLIFSCKSTESTILSLYAKIRATENPSSGIFYAVKLSYLVARKSQNFERAILRVAASSRFYFHISIFISECIQLSICNICQHSKWGYVHHKCNRPRVLFKVYRATLKVFHVVSM